MIFRYEQRIEVGLRAHDRIHKFKNVVVSEMMLYSFAYQMDRIVGQLVQFFWICEMPDN